MHLKVPKERNLGNHGRKLMENEDFILQPAPIYLFDSISNNCSFI